MLSRSSRLTRAACAVALALSQIAGHAQGDGTAPVPRALAREIGHDFGPVDSSAVLSHTFTIRNAGTGPLTVLGVDCSQAGMTSRFERVIQPGATGRITIEWNLAGTTGDLDAQVVVHVNDVQKPRITFRLTGTTTRSIEVQPSPDVFVTIFDDETAERRVTIVNHDARPLAITAVRPVGPHFTATLRTVEPGRRYEVLVRVPSGLAPGRYVDPLYVDTNHPRQGTLQFGVNTFVKSRMYASPDVIDFGDVPLDKVRAGLGAAWGTQSLTLRTRTGDFAITAISSDIPALRIVRSPGGVSSTFGLVVTLDPVRLQPGSLEGVIRVDTSDKAFPSIVIPVHGHVQ
jgi:hypothetical protein